MYRLRIWLFAAVFYPGSAFYVLLTPVAAVLGARQLGWWVRGWTRFHNWAARSILGITIRIEGEVPRGPALIVAKHEAMFETIALVAILGRPVPVMKAELMRIPLWGWAARRFGSIVVDRAGSSAALRTMVRAAKAGLAEGRPIVLFPEGTRVPHGLRAPLQSGFAGLYRALDVPTVPLAIDSGRVWPRRGPQGPGAITFRFGEPIPPRLPRREAEARVLEAINALNGRSIVGAAEIGT
jgi:1-acyl-sn-glycerol-3-phosphate acyltransferase